jgi:parvulin-like peptidyl-prolyl isomerase
MLMKRLLREPLVHFFVLGALLFGVYGWLNREGFYAPDEIVVSRGQVRNLHEQFERVWQRAPTQDELRGLIDGWVREEIFYREALAMGLDRDDPVVRRRMTQKVQFIIDGATPAAPTAEELQAWLDRHVEKYAVEPTYSLRQIYFDPGRPKSDLEADLAAARRALDRGQPVAGDSSMLPSTLSAASASEVARTFGAYFERELRDLQVGSWQGPLRSGFGLHLVELTARTAERNATLEEVRTAVERDLLHARTQEANAASYDRLRANYAVRIEGGDLAVAEPAG